MRRRLKIWWNDNWYQQGWVVVFILLLLLIIAWGGVASAYGVTNASRDAEIRALIRTTHDWELAKDTLNRRKQIILANPLSIPDPEGAWIKAENDMYTAQKDFEAAGFKALYGELIIFSAALFQIILALVLTKSIASIFERIRNRGRSRFDGNDLRKDWIERIHAGQALTDEDEILELIDDESINSKLSQAEVLRSQQAMDVYKKLMAKCRKAKREEIPWLQISNSLYRLALICKIRKGWGGKKWEQCEQSIRHQHQQLRRIIQLDVREAAYSAILVPVLFVAIFAILNFYWNVLSGDVLGEQLFFWRIPILWFGAAFVANGIVHVWGASFAHWITEKTWIELNDVVVNATKGPLSALATAIFLVVALTIDPSRPPLEFGPFLTWIMYEATANILRTIVVIFVGTWFISFFANLLTTNILINWTSVSKQTIDKAVVDLAQLITTSLIVTISIVITLTIIQDSIRKAIGTDLATLLSIFVAIIAAVVGYASRFIFENLLGGISLQIEKPFEIGDRIQLPDGRLCEVVSLGLRRTLLHNIDDSSEIAIPNSELAKWSITNTSRMDSSRINIKVWIADPSQVKLAQEIMLDIAYLEKEIDQMRVFRDELNNKERDTMRENLFLSRYRITIIEGMERLIRMYINIRGTTVSRIIGGTASSPEYVFNLGGDSEDDPWRIVIWEIRSLWQNYRENIWRETEWLFGRMREVESGGVNKLLFDSYRRAVSEVVYLESMTSSSILDAKMRDVALYEHIDIENLLKVLRCLSGVKSTKSGISISALKKIRAKLNEFEVERLGIVSNINEKIAIFENYIYAIREQYPDISSELDGILGEINREPSVSSEYSDNGHVRLTLSCYVLYLERGLEIHHKLNREIGRRFKNAGIRLG